MDLEKVDWGKLQVDLPRRELIFEDGSRVELSELETVLLRYLIVNPGRAISRDELLVNVWRLTPEGLCTRTVDMQIARLREKLKDDSGEPKLIKTVRGMGYMLGNLEIGKPGIGAQSP
jgi:DNA-binding response OmpR family regulator